MKKIAMDFSSFLQIAKEFIKALGQKHTYSIHKNWYCFFGILWGIPVPIVTLAIDLHSTGYAYTISDTLQIISSHPLHLFFLLHPVFFGIVFGAMGTVRHHKQQKIEEFEKSLISNNLQLQNANEKLKELDKLKSNFLSMVSHELRTPLTTIQGYITFLETEKAGTLNPSQKEYLRISEETTDMLNRLIEELLDLSRIERGEFQVNLSCVDMSEVINKAVDSLKFSAETSGVTLEINMPKVLPQVKADNERIFQVVVNLIENAIKFNHRAGKVGISASFSEPNRRVTFCVSDTGIGIPHNELEKIFDNFYQVDSSGKRKYGGCGLGLAISKSILNLHKGRIWAESKLGKGSKFFFELPSC